MRNASSKRLPSRLYVQSLSWQAHTCSSWVLAAAIHTRAIDRSTRAHANGKNCIMARNREAMQHELQLLPRAELFIFLFVRCSLFYCLQRLLSNIKRPSLPTMLRFTLQTVSHFGRNKGHVEVVCFSRKLLVQKQIYLMMTRRRSPFSKRNRQNDLTIQPSALSLKLTGFLFHLSLILGQSLLG